MSAFDVVAIVAGAMIASWFGLLTIIACIDWRTRRRSRRRREIAAREIGLGPDATQAEIDARLNRAWDRLLRDEYPPFEP